MATGAVHSSTIQSTPPDLINFFYLCRIILEDVPDILRWLFSQEILNKYKRQWVDGIKCGKWFLQQDRFTSKLSSTQKQNLANGQTQDWDSTLLFHTLLYSSHLLLADPIPGNKVSIQHNSKKLISTVPIIDFTRVLRQGDKIILDLGSADFIRVEVAHVRPTELFLKWPLKLPQSAPVQLVCDGYMCSREWHAVEQLSFLRNDRFAHCKTACITNNELGYVIQDIEAVYKTLHVPPSRITKMRSIISEPIVESSIVQKIEYYKEKWLKESEHYVQVKEDIGHLQTDVKEIKEKDIPEIKDNFKEVQKALMESKEHHDELKHKQQAIENEMHLTVVSVSTLEDKYEAMQGQTSGQLDSLKSRQSTLEDKQSLQEQTLTLHGTQLADNSEKITQTSNEISTLRCQQSQIASRVSHTADFVRTISSEQNQQMIKVGDKLASLETTERQLSEEVAQSGEIIRQLSVEQGKLTENVTVLYKDIEDVKVNVSQVKEEVELLKHKGPSSKLSISHFESDITYYNDQYHVGTRQWLLDEIFSWISQPPRNINQPNFCMIVSNPGMGKSVVASKVLSLVRESGKLAGWFFFQHHMGRRSNPRMLVQTLCHQMMSTIEGYSALIEEDLADMDIASHTLFELFAYLIREPLYRLPLEHDRMVIVIDALDECDFESRPDLLKLLLREFIKLPKWMNIILTSRPDQKILQTLKRIKRIIEILPDDPRNLDDIRLFLHDFLKEKMSADEFESGVQLLVTKSEGMFLYFHYAIDTLEGRKIISLQELHSLLPDGIDDYYEHNFKRLFNELGREKYQKFLQGVLASRSDFPQRFVGPLLDLNPQEAIKVVSLVSPLLPIHNECINVFHKSVRDWLLDEELAGDYGVDPMEGHKHLAYLCHSKLQDIKANFSSSTSLSEQVNQYVILNVIHHMCTCIDPLSCHQLISAVEDLQFLYLRLLFSHGSTEGLLEDLAETQKALAKHKQLRQRTQDIYLFIQRCAHLLNGKPYLVFQCALNEPDMFSKRLGIQRFLANPLQAFPDLKVLLQVVNKSQHFSSSLITFTCDDDITSCITSPDQKHVICSDSKGIVYFWEIESGELLNKADLSQEFNMLNQINQCSISPDGELISYGNLKEVLNMDAKKMPLISTDRDHNVNTCIFSPDGKKLVAFTSYIDGFFRLMKELQFPYDISFSVQLWDISKSKCRTLHTVKRKENRPMCVCFSSDGKLLYCGYRNGRIIQWDVISGIALALLFPNGLVVKRESEDLFTEEFEALDNTIISIDYSPDGHFLAACCKEGVVIWDVTALELLIVQQTEDEARFINCSFSCDSQHLAASTNKGTLKVWAISNFTFSLEVSTNPDGSLNPLSECCFDNQKNVLCVFQNTARIYAYSTLVQTTHTHINYEAVHPNRANSSLFLPDEKYAVTCGGKSLCLWDVSSCHLVASAYGIVGGYLIRVSADGKTLLTYGDRCYIEVWDVKGLTKTHTLVHQEQANVPIPFYDPDDSSPTDICHCAISVNGIVVGGTGQGDLFVWYGNRLEFVKELKFHESLISFVEFSPNGNAFVSADTDGVIMMWKIQSQNESDFEVNMIPLHAHNDSIEQVFYSPQGRRIASCSMDKSVHLYNGSNGDLIECLIGHSSGIMRLGFSCDGCHLVSGDEKGCIIVWDGVTGHQQLRIQPHLDKIIFDVCFVSGNKYICSRDVHAGYITVNEVTSGKEVASLSFSTDIFTMSGSTSWKDSSYILCGLKDGSIKFVKLRDTETDSLDILG